MKLLKSRHAQGSSNDSAGRTRVFFATDLHSSEACFRKLLATPRIYDVDRVIMGGDCTGKMLVPMVERAGDAGAFECQWGGETTVSRGEEAIAAQERRVRDA